MRKSSRGVCVALLLGSDLHCGGRQVVVVVVVKGEETAP